MSSEHPRYSLWDAMRAAVSLSIKAIEEVRALSREPGPVGERGPEGSPGKLQDVRQWTDGVSYEGDLVHWKGSTFQAIKDTAREPPHADWLSIAVRGSDGQNAREWTHRGVYDPQAEYKQCDWVSRDGGAWLAVKDDPGALDSGDWRQLSQRGKAGAPGARGEQGPQGKQGQPGVTIAAAYVDDFELVLTMDDGTKHALNLRPMFERYHSEAQQ